VSVLVLALIGCGGPEGSPAPDPAREDPTETLPTDDDSTPPSALPAVRLNEALSDNHGGLEDGDGDHVDWIELFNAGPDPVDLGGWHLSDDPADPSAWTFPEVELEPAGFLLVYASGKGAEGPAGELHTSFRLDAAGESLVLSDAAGAEVSRLDLPALAEDRSHGIAQPVQEGRPLGELRWLGSAPDGWTAPDFDDSGWATATLPLGYDGPGGDGPTENVALFRPTTQTSDGYGYTGAQATDGELSTFSHTGDADLAPTWEVDLGGAYAVTGITLHNRPDCCGERLYNVTVSVVNEGVATDVSGVLNPVSGGATPTSPGDRLEVTGRWTADRVRVAKTAVNGAYSSEWLSLAEVVVDGVVATPYVDRLATTLPDAPATVRLRLPFEGVPADRVVLGLDVDDGVIAWLDGVELGRLHVDAYGAVEDHPAEGAETLPVDPGLFGEGPHLLALEVHSADADDLFLDVDLVLQTLGEGGPAWFDVPTPGAPNGEGWEGVVADPEVDVPRGFLDGPTSVTLSSPTPGATLRYTLDGSDPAVGGVEVPPGGDELARVTLDLATTSFLRARATREGWADSGTVTHTWILLDDVIRQPAAPAGWPATWDDPSQGSFAADYAMDPDVVDDPAYHADLLAGLREIPTLSLVFDPDQVFGPEGIYVRSLERGDEAEVPVSAELILPDGSTGFAVNCGLRLHGYGWRYHSATLKHAFRLQFSGAYGPRKLEYPWFPDSTAERFDDIVLRAQGSRGWQDFRDPEQADYIRDAFARDTARDLGKWDGHAVFVHLYLNGLYWGLYNPVERPDAGFAEEYLGGDDQDYDAINRRTSVNEAIDGDLEAWNEMLALADADLGQPAAYAALTAMVDVDSLIHTMLIHQYTVNRDGPCCFDSNNMRAVRRRADGERWSFFVWDMEYSIWEATDSTNIDIDVAGSMSHVYTRMRENPDFRARYAELAAEALAPGGALSPEVARERWLVRADEIRNAVVAESARWGDAKREPPYTRDVEWDAEQARILEEFIPARTDELAAQLRAAGLLDL